MAAKEVAAMIYYSDLRNLLDLAEKKSNKYMEICKGNDNDVESIRRFNKILFALYKAYDVLEEAIQD